MDEQPISGNRTMMAPLAELVERVEHERRLDGVVGALRPLARRLDTGPQAAILRGDPLGHAMHPLLTDIPIGCWTSSFLLDLVGGRRSRRASQRLIGLGLVSLVPTAAAGLVDWGSLQDAPRQRAGVAHAAANSAAGLLYFWSWRQRRRDHHLSGVALGLLAATVASVGGFLGGHLAYARRAGVGARGGSEAPSTITAGSSTEDSSAPAGD